MNNKNLFTYVITLVITGLLISISAAGAYQKSEYSESILVCTKQKKIDFNIDSAQAKAMTCLEPSDSGKVLDIPVFSGCLTPAISHSGSSMVAGYYSFDQANVYYSASLDGGETWSDALGWAVESPELPCVDGCGDVRYIASYVPSPYEDDGSALFKTTIGDVNDFENTCNGVYWTWNDLGAGYTNFIDVEVAGYTASDPDENTWAYGAHAMIGDHGELGSQTGFFCYQCTEDGTAWIYTLADNPGDFNDATSCGIDIDQGTNFAYAVYNYDNNENMDLYIFIVNFNIWGELQSYPIHDDTYVARINSSGNDNAVDISALNDNVIIISERNGAIIAYYTNDKFSTVHEAQIDSSGSQPRIVHTGALSAVCSYIKGGVLYTSVTEDGGVTWDSPNVNSEETPVISNDICGFGALYESGDTIYFAPIQANFPVIEIGSITGGIGVKAVIQNTGTADATDISYTIGAVGGLLGFINSEMTGTISIPAGGETTVSLPMFIGIGAVTISVTAGLASSEIEGKQLLIFTIL